MYRAGILRAGNLTRPEWSQPAGAACVYWDPSIGGGGRPFKPRPAKFAALARILYIVFQAVVHKLLK